MEKMLHFQLLVAPAVRKRHLLASCLRGFLRLLLGLLGEQAAERLGRVALRDLADRPVQHRRLRLMLSKNLLQIARAERLADFAAIAKAR